MPKVLSELVRPHYINGSKRIIWIFSIFANFTGWFLIVKPAGDGSPIVYLYAKCVDTLFHSL